MSKEQITLEIKEAEELLIQLKSFKAKTMPQEYVDELNDGINFWEVELKILKEKLLTKK